MQFHFLLLHGSVCVKGSHRANNGKQRTRLPGDLSFIKTSSRKGHIRLKLVIIMIRLKSAKLQTPIKFFSFWACVLAAWCSVFKWCRFKLAVYCEFQWRYSLAPPEFIKFSRSSGVESIFSIFGIPDHPISHGLFPYKEHTKQPLLRRHRAKTPQKSVLTMFQKILITLIPFRSNWLSNVGECFLVFNSKKMYLNVGNGKKQSFSSLKAFHV